MVEMGICHPFPEDSESPTETALGWSRAELGAVSSRWGGEQGQEMEPTRSYLVTFYIADKTSLRDRRFISAYSLRGFSPWLPGPTCVDRKQDRRNTGRG